MTIRTRIEIIAGVICAAFLLVLLYQWHNSEMRNAAARATTDVLQKTVANAQKTIDAAGDAIAKRDAAMERQQQAFTAQLASIRTPAQAQPLILDMAAKNLPAPIQTATDAKTGAVSYTIPPEDVVPLYKKLATCEQSAGQLDVCQHDVVDMKSQAAELATQRDSYKQEAATWKKAAKGGPFIKRAVKVAEHVAIGAAIGYAIAKH